MDADYVQQELGGIEVATIQAETVAIEDQTRRLRRACRAIGGALILLESALLTYVAADAVVDYAETGQGPVNNITTSTLTGVAILATVYPIYRNAREAVPTS